MNNLIHDLTVILEQEAAIYEEILRTSKNKTEIIVEGKVNDLEAITKLEQSFILQLSKLENQREIIVGNIAKAMGSSIGELTISKISEHVEEAGAKKLEAVQAKMTKVIKELDESNGINARLIKNSLEYIGFTLGMLTSVGNEDNNYGVNAEKAEGKSRNLFDFKV